MPPMILKNLYISYTVVRLLWLPHRPCGLFKRLLRLREFLRIREQFREIPVGYPGVQGHGRDLNVPGVRPPELLRQLPGYVVVEIYRRMTRCTCSVRTIPPPLAVTVASTVAVETSGGRSGVVILYVSGG